MTQKEINEFWDALCSELGILEDKEKRDLIREYGRRMYKIGIEEIKFDLQNHLRCFYCLKKLEYGSMSDWCEDCLENN